MDMNENNFRILQEFLQDFLKNNIWKHLLQNFYKI